jgi:hypothetical protein
MRIGAERFQIVVHGEQHVAGAGKAGLPMPSFSASTHQRCHRKLWRRRVPKSEMRRSGSSRSRSTFSHILRLGARIEHVERERPERPSALSASAAR